MKILPQETDRLAFYKLLIQVITPRPIAWVSTISETGVPNLAPFSFSTAISTNPPAHLFCPVTSSKGIKKDTLINCETQGEYVCGVVPFAMREKMAHTSASLDPETDEFTHAGLTPIASHQVTPPCIQESPVNLECKVLQIIHLAEGPSAGNIVIGEIVAMHINDALLQDGTIDADALDTIGRMGGADYCRTTERFEITRPA